MWVRAYMCPRPEPRCHLLALLSFMWGGCFQCARAGAQQDRKCLLVWSHQCCDLKAALPFALYARARERSVAPELAFTPSQPPYLPLQTSLTLPLPSSTQVRNRSYRNRSQSPRQEKSARKEEAHHRRRRHRWRRRRSRTRTKEEGS